MNVNVDINGAADERRLFADLGMDVRSGLRLLRQSPGFAVAAVLSLSLGIGANTALFSLVDQLLFRSLPVSNPNTLALIGTRTKGDELNYRLPYRDFLNFQSSTALSGLAASSSVRVTMSPVMSLPAAPASRQSASTDRTVRDTSVGEALIVSGDYFGTLGISPAMGRLIEPADDVGGARAGQAVAVLTYAYWQRQFDGRGSVIGQDIRLNDTRFTIVGVSAKGFRGTRVGQAPDVMVPMAMQQPLMPDVAASMLQGVGTLMPWLEIMARLAPDVSLAQGSADINRIDQLGQEAKGSGGKGGGAARQERFALEPGGQGLSELRKRFANPLLVLMGVVALVLAIACANVASLSLARAETRRREFAVRVALGARRWRLARQLLTESMMLAALGGVGGLLLAWSTGSVLAAWVVPDSPDAFAQSPDLRVLGFALLVSVVAGLGFGLVPAWSASRADAVHAQRSTAAEASRARWRPGLGRVIVGGQVAVSLMLLVMATLFVRTLVNLRDLDLGFANDQVVALRLDPPGSAQRWLHAPRLDQFYQQVLAQVRQTPGVLSASLASDAPVGTDSLLQAPVRVPGYVPEVDEDMTVRVVSVYPDYFATLRASVISGRELGPSDLSPAAPPVALINQTMADKYFGDTDPIGREFVQAWQQTRYRIVGITADLRDRGPRDAVEPVAYMPFLHTPSKWGQMTLLVRTADEPGSTQSALRQLLSGLEPGMQPPASSTLTQRLDTALRQERLVALISSLFGALGLILACLGLYGVMAYASSRRTAEFGVRLALGAEPAAVRRLVLRESMVVVGLGAVVGLAGAATLAQMLSTMFFGLATFDLISFVAATVLLTLLAALASAIPAVRSSRVDPLIALRQD